MRDPGRWKLQPGDVGQRVVIRRYADVADGRQRFSDLLGELVELTDATLTVQTGGAAVEVPLAQVHQAKTVPKRRGPTAREIAALERAATDAWPPVTVEPLGQWRLRWADGFTGRANSALPLGDPGLPMQRALDRVTEFYRRHGAAAQIDVPLPLAAPLERELLGRGWAARCTVEVHTIALAELIGATPDGAGFRLREEPSEQALRLLGGRRGQLPAAAWHVLTAVDLVRFAEAYGDGGQLLAMARGSVTEGRLGLFAIETIPAVRRTGLACGAIGALARWAAQSSAQRAFLQVESTNRPALALYGRLGFQRHHEYRRYRLD